MFGTKHHEFDNGRLQPQASQQEARGRWRLKLVKLVFLVAFVGIIVRLVQVQIIESPKYREIAQRQYEAKVVLPAVRGNIYDRTGNVLASNTMFVSLAADPKIAGDDAWRIADKLSRVFGKPRKFYLEKLDSPKRFVWLERQVRPEVAKKVQSHSLRGVLELAEPKRLYHYPGVAGALVGCTDVDNTGLSGIELLFDEQLRGTDGYIILQRDGRGKARPSVDYLRVDPVGGNNVVLAIDFVCQSIAEDKLKRGVERTKADGGMVIMTNPSTGEVLAMAQHPPMDPSAPGASNIEHQRLRAVTDMFEPGSVFKIVTVSAALEDRLVKPEQRFNAERGSYAVKLPDGKTRVIRDSRAHDMLTLQEAMEFSSNIVMAKVSDLIGAERLYTKARAFGFGAETGIEYPGEAKGDMKRPVLWSGTTLNTMAYGYEVGVTPIQIAAAYGAVANGGVLMRPILIKKIVASSGTVAGERMPEPVRKVMPSHVVEIVKRFLEGVVERGTATGARIEGVRVAGKTGTSRKYVEGKYEAGSYTTSFVGFFPVDRPAVVCLVMLDNPREGGYTGGAAAAPIFREIARQIVTTGKAVIPETDGNLIVRAAKDVTVPDVISLKQDIAETVLESRGLTAEVYGSGVVVRQAPVAGTSVNQGSRVTLLLNGKVQRMRTDVVIVPDLRGLSVRRAVNRLAIDKLQARVQGSGIVVRQTPPAGQSVPPGASIFLACEPQTLAEGND